MSRQTLDHCWGEASVSLPALGWNVSDPGSVTGHLSKCLSLAVETYYVDSSCMEEGQQADHLCLACVSQSLILSGVGTPACPPVSAWDICHGPRLCVCGGVVWPGYCQLRACRTYLVLPVQQRDCE